MSNVNFNPQMSEETFKELLDVMEKRFTLLRILDCDPEYKLAKSASLSKLQAPCEVQGFLFKKPFQTESSENLVKEHKWVEFFNANLSTSQVKDSKENIKLNGEELQNTTRLIGIDVIKNSGELVKKMKLKEENPEYMEVEESPPYKPLSSRVGPKKSYPSFFSIQATPPSNLPTSASSVVLAQSKLPRAVSETLDTKKVPEVEKSDFNVSKSFGQYTFKENVLDSSEEIVDIKKPESEIKNLFLKEPKDIKQELEKGKKKLRPLMQERKKRLNHNCSFWQIIFFLLLPVAVFLVSAILNQHEINIKFCNPTFNFTNTTKNLPKLVHGQDQSVKDLISFLQSDDSTFKVTAFVGGTGVGKTHVTNIIKNTLSESDYSFEYFPPVYNKIRQAYSKLSICRCNVIVLENLGNEDISDAAFFSHSLRNRASNLCVLILALFNTQVTDNNLRRSLDLKESVNNIEDGFKKEGVEITAIRFEPLREESIVKCIKDAIRESRLKISLEEINQIKESLLISNSGCKGAYSKVQLFGKVID